MLIQFSQTTKLYWLILFLASILYSIQIYADFAGYSMMAIAVGKILGFELTENFQRPYLAVSVTDFGIVGIYHYLLGSKTMSIFLWEVVDAQDYATIKYICYISH